MLGQTNLPQPDYPTVWKGPTVNLRFRRLQFGQPVLQQEWLGMRTLPDGERETVREWRDVVTE